MQKRILENCCGRNCCDCLLQFDPDYAGCDNKCLERL